MTVREYIGARYVPLFIGEWNSSHTYEPLSVVTYQGNSYTSRQYVPNGVAITNTAYWAPTGNYNAQIEAYRQEVQSLSQCIPSSEFSSQNTVKDYIDGITERKAVYIGNSFALGTGSTGGNNGIFARTKDYFSEAYLFYKSGTGFETYSGHGADNTFNQLVNDAYNSTSFDNEEITDVIFISAMGDTRAMCENDGVFSSLKATIENAQSKFPNAKVYIYFAEITATKATQESYSKFYPMAQLRVHQLFEYYAANYNYIYLGWGGWSINFRDTYTSSDNYHPNDSGYKYLSNFFLNVIEGKEAYYLPVKYNLPSNEQPKVQITMYSPFNGVMYINPDIRSLFGEGNITTTPTRILDFYNVGSTLSHPICIPKFDTYDLVFAYGNHLEDSVRSSYMGQGEYQVVKNDNDGIIQLKFKSDYEIDAANISGVFKVRGTSVYVPIHMFINPDLSVS